MKAVKTKRWLSSFSTKYKTMMRFSIFLFALLLTQPLLGQRYNTAVGLRFGNNTYGLSVRQRVLGRTTLEGMLVADQSRYTGTLLAKQHFPLIGRGFNIFAGAGAHYGAQRETGDFRGFDIMLGAELKTPALPITVSADIKPAYHLDHTEWFDMAAALSVHYVIGKDTKNKRERAKRKKQREKERDRKDRQKEKARNKKAKEKAKQKREKKEEGGSFWDFLKADKADHERPTS